MSAVRFGLDPSIPGPVLLHAPLGRAWWSRGARLACVDDTAVWVLDADSALSVAIPRGIAAEDVLRTIGMLPDGGPWTLDEPDVPEALRIASGATRFAAGRGAVWRSDEWMVRWERGHAPRVPAHLRADETVLVGPCGALLLGSGRWWVRGASPSGSAMALPTKLQAGIWTRWSDDGRQVAGVDEAGMLVRIDLATARAVARVHDALPLDGNGTLLDLTTGEIRGPTGVRATGIREASWALDGPLLGGPGGLVWDLGTGRPLFTVPRLVLGATVAAGDRWANVGWEDGWGIWLEPTSGEVVGRFRIPLEADEAVADAVFDSGTVFVRTDADRCFVVRDSTVHGVDTAPAAPDPPQLGPGFAVHRSGLTVGDHRYPIAVDAAVRVGDRIWAWSTDGLLVGF